MKTQDHLNRYQEQNNPEEYNDVKLFIVSLSKQCVGYSRLTMLPPRFYLKVAKESLDFVDMDTMLALLNFPYQHILCWGSSPTTFKFTVEDRVAEREGKELHAEKDEEETRSEKTNQGE